MGALDLTLSCSADRCCFAFQWARRRQGSCVFPNVINMGDYSGRAYSGVQTTARREREKRKGLLTRVLLSSQVTSNRKTLFGLFSCHNALLCCNHMPTYIQQCSGYLSFFSTCCCHHSLAAGAYVLLSDSLVCSLCFWLPSTAVLYILLFFFFFDGEGSNNQDLTSWCETSEITSRKVLRTFKRCVSGTRLVIHLTIVRRMYCVSVARFVVLVLVSQSVLGHHRSFLYLQTDPFRDTIGHSCGCKPIRIGTRSVILVLVMQTRRTCCLSFWGTIGLERGSVQLTWLAAVVTNFLPCRRSISRGGGAV